MAKCWYIPVLNCRLGLPAGQADLPGARTVDHLNLAVVADGRHSVPTKLRLEADGVPVRELTVPPVTDGSQNGATQQVTVPFAPVTGAHLRLVVEAARAVTTIDDQTHQAVTLPVAIAETGLAGIPAPAAAGSVPSACRSDLLRVDGHAVSVRVTGAASAARDGLSLEPCPGPERPGAESGRPCVAP